MKQRGWAAWWRRVKGSSNQPKRGSPPPGGLSAVSQGTDTKRFFSDSFLPLPGRIPFESLHLYRRLRDSIPDISDAVWTWKRLCQTERKVLIEELGNGVSRDAVLNRLTAFENRINMRGGGLAGLLDLFYSSLFTFGAAALEAVPGGACSGIHDVVPVDVWTVRFRHNGQRLMPWQVTDGNEIALPEDFFFYVGLDRDGTNPYGRSMIAALPGLVRIQQELLSDMARATRNAGWNRLHVRYHPEDRETEEEPEAYKERIRTNLHRLSDVLKSTDIDQNLITLDNVSVEVLAGNQRNQVFYENHKAVEEQVITGMHMMPVLLGRNYGSTETYGTAQFEVVNRQVQTVNRQVADMLTRIYSLELALSGINARVRVSLEGNRTVDVLRAAQTRRVEIDTTLRLLEQGLISEREAKARLQRADS
ncbi:MAG TPA: hypothetical protein PLY90_09885 [Candidatus Hydrogenedentes bacterium]|nr:MAG: hypothetical protein BWY07_02168 [Candidatus Hydrogenedentes bacterium ADurb.Bin170]HPX87527.1 hypothetical protein [Candidatus Hydrogenedentota bacterium]HQB03594.1 hypothetical protein [Candidatus Hydrogenedentota bacterium]